MAKGSNFKNTPHEKVHLNYFQGGTTVDTKLGIPNSFYYSQGLDFRSVPSQMSVLPGPTNIATANVTDLIQAMEQDLNGIRWGVGSNGNLYKIDASNNFDNVATLSSKGSSGILYNQVTDQLYIPGQTTASMYGQLTSGNPKQPQLRSDLFAQSASTDPGCTNLYNPGDGFFDGTARNNAASVGSAAGITPANVASVTSTTATNTYTPTTALTENTGDFCFFAPDIEPFYSIQVFIVKAGTGDWTLTLHDSLNNSLGVVTIVNASIKANAFNEFKFSGPIRALVSASQTGTSATYHWHITSTVADGTVAVVNQSDLSSANFLLFAYRLIATKNGWHPTAFFTGTGKPLLCIGNGQYLSTYDFSNDANPSNQQWQRHNLTFKQGYEVCGITTNNQYLVIAVERRSSNSNRNFQDGALYFWSGSNQSAPDFVIDIPMGAPYALQTFNNVTYFIVAGSLFAWSGGQTVLKVRKLAYQNTNYLGAVDSTIVGPNMMAIRYNLLQIGYPSTTTNVNINYGVYSWGSVELTFPNSLDLSYTLSNGFINTTASSNLTIGCVYNFVDSMYISWSYVDANSVTHYGVDLLNNFSTPSPVFSWQSLIYDGGITYKTKEALRLRIGLLTLPSGYTLQPGYSLDRGAWVWGTTANAGDTAVFLELNNARFKELQWGFMGTSSGATAPAIINGVTMETNPLPDEVDMAANLVLPYTNYQ